MDSETPRIAKDVTEVSSKDSACFSYGLGSFNMFFFKFVLLWVVNREHSISVSEQSG